MRVALQAWYDDWRAAHQETNLIHVNKTDSGEPSLSQVHFVRDTIATLVWSGVLYDNRPSEPPPRSDCRETAWVIGEHRSKSVRLPVYSLERPDLGIRFVLRDNFHDWKLSVASELPIESDLFPYLFHASPPIEPEYTGNEFSSVYFEGFPEELVFGYHATDQRRWSASLGAQALWTVVLICMRTVGAVKPKQWHTQASFRAYLDAETAARKARQAREGV
jgi:hypothetical protein